MALLLVEGRVSVGPGAGIIYTAWNEIYPIVGKFATSNKSILAFKEAASHLSSLLAQKVSAFDMARVEVSCYEEDNPLEARKAGKIIVVFMMQPSRIAEFFCERFLLGRLVHDGQTYLTVECLTLKGVQ